MFRINFWMWNYSSLAINVKKKKKNLPQCVVQKPKLLHKNNHPGISTCTFFSLWVKMLIVHHIYRMHVGEYLCWFVLPLLLILLSANTHEYNKVCGVRCYSASVTHQRACANSQTDSRSITTVDRTLTSRGISSHSRSRTNKLSPNIRFAWRRGSLWMCVYVWEWVHAYIKQRRSVNIEVWRINTLFFFLLKERLMLKYHSNTVAGPEHFPRLEAGSPFLICCISRKSCVQIKISLSNGGIFAYETSLCVIFNKARENQSVRIGEGGPRNMHLHQCCGRILENTFRKLAFLK